MPITANIVLMLINVIFGALAYLAILRFLIQWAGVPFINQFAQIITRVSMPFIKPLTYIIGTYKHYNISAVLFGLLVEVIRIILLVAFVSHSFPDIGGLLLWALIVLAQHVCTILLYSTVIFALMSWFPALSSSALGQCIVLIINPIISVFRRFIPAFGGLDFSAMAFVFILYIARMLLDPLLFHAMAYAMA